MNNLFKLKGIAHIQKCTCIRNYIGYIFYTMIQYRAQYIKHDLLFTVSDQKIEVHNLNAGYEVVYNFIFYTLVTVKCTVK